jgi:hypothetical protein
MSALRAVGPEDRALAEVSPLASELVHAYGRMVTFYRDQMDMSAPEADARARGVDDTPEETVADLARIRDRPPDQVSWYDLNRVADRDPEALAELWRDQKSAARDELESGHRAARALDWDGRPWDRARALAIRDGFRADYQPHGGVEAALVDLAAEAYGDYLAWSEHLHMQAATEVSLERHDLTRHGAWKPQRIGSAAAMEQSARMAERAHARFLRTIAALDARRRTGPVTLGHAHHVHIDHQQLTIIPAVPDRDRPGHQRKG